MMSNIESEKERWKKPDYLTVEAILNYWFCFDKQDKEKQRLALKYACMQGQVECLYEGLGKSEGSVAELFESGNLVIKRQSLDDWADGRQIETKDPGTPKDWFDQIMEDNDASDRLREEKKKAEEERLKREQRKKEKRELKERARIEAEAKFEVEQAFKNKSKQKLVVQNEDYGPVDRRKYNSYVHLVGAVDQRAIMTHLET